MSTDISCRATPRSRAVEALRGAAEIGSTSVTLSVDDLGAILAGHDGADYERRHPFPGNVLLHVQDMGCEESVDLGERLDDVARETRTPTTNLDAAMLLTSATADPFATAEADPIHRPVLDLDMPVTLLPSSTEGHHHLLIDRPITWAKYVVVLDALADAGLLEVGYVEASKRRGGSAVRVPWFRKGDIAPDLDGNRVDPRDLAAQPEVDPWQTDVPAF